MVYDVVQQVFNGALERGYNKELALNLFEPIDTGSDETKESLGFLSLEDITDRILDGQAASDKSQKERNMRLGYMGHLTLIAEEVCKFGTRFSSETTDSIVSERVNREAWTHYIDGVLTETRDKDNAVLGGVRPESALARNMGHMSLGIGNGNSSSALTSAGIGPSLSDDADGIAEASAGGTAYEAGERSMLSGFGDDDEEDELNDAGMGLGQDRRGSGSSPFTDDEQVGELSFDEHDMDYR